MSTRRAYFRVQTPIDASQEQTIEGILNRVISVETGKADQAYIDSQLAIAQQSVAAVQSSLSAYATSDQVTSLLAGKADAASIDALSSAVSTAQAAVAGLASSKADAAEVAARVAAEDQFFGAFREAIFLEDPPGSGSEFSYGALGVTPAGGAGASS